MPVACVRKFARHVKETFEKRFKSCNLVIPAEAGIQCFQGLSGFRIALRLSGTRDLKGYDGFDDYCN